MRCISVGWWTTDDATLKRYLLGQLDPTQQARLEQQYFADDAVFERLLIVEEELLDAYVRDELPEAERALVKDRFLSHSAGRQLVQAARGLQQCLSEAQNRFPVPDRTPPLRWLTPMTATAAAAIVAVAIAAWLAVTNRRLAEHLSREEARSRTALASERARAERLADQLQQERSARTTAEQAAAALPRAGPVVMAVLTPGLLRDTGRATRLRVSSNATLVVLRLELGETARDGYRAILRTIDQADVWRQDLSTPLPRGEASIAITIPAPLLRSGDYLLTLQGRVRDGAYEDVGTYFFRVVETPSRNPH
jgi:hypothetical protein